MAPRQVTPRDVSPDTARFVSRHVEFRPIFDIRATAAPFIRFAALFGIISLVGYRWSVALRAALHCRVSRANGTILLSKHYS